MSLYRRIFVFVVSAAMVGALSLAACSNSQSNTKASARQVASSHLQCEEAELSYLVYEGGSGKFGLQPALYYAFQGCGKKTCVECYEGECTIQESPSTDDLCPPGIVRTTPAGQG